jgi:hypothetical protein
MNRLARSAVKGGARGALLRGTPAMGGARLLNVHEYVRAKAHTNTYYTDGARQGRFAFASIRESNPSTPLNAPPLNLSHLPPLNPLTPHTSQPSHTSNTSQPPNPNLSTSQVAMDLMRGFGIPVPNTAMGESVEEVKMKYKEVIGDGNDCVIKAMVLTGGRGLGHFDNGFKGGVHMCSKEADVTRIANSMLGAQLITKQTGEGGLPCTKVCMCVCMCVCVCVCVYIYVCVWYAAASLPLLNPSLPP